MSLAASGAIDNGLLILLGALCLVILSVSLLRRLQHRRVTARDLTREQRARLRDQQELQGSLEELLVQLEETAARINAQIDARLTRLEAALQAADERVGRLDAPSCGARPAALASTPPPPPLPGTSKSQRVRELADKGTSALAIADALAMPIGEVELILNLRGFAPSTGVTTEPAG
jgi:hypothetical protein